METKNKIRIVVAVGVICVCSLAIFWWTRNKSEQKIIFNQDVAQVSVDQNDEVNIDNVRENQETPKASNDTSVEMTTDKDSAKNSPVVSQTTEDDHSQSNATNKETQQSSSSIKIVNKLVSFGYQKSSGRKIDTIIVHSSYCAVGNDPFDVGCVIGEYRDNNVSAHYLIGRDGTIYRLVKEENVAWHAGVAKVPDGRTDVNSFSIGIEMINTKSDKFTDDQYAALNKLLAQIKSEYTIKYILGHDQVAPGRKDDPWNIVWDKVKK